MHKILPAISSRETIAVKKPRRNSHALIGGEPERASYMHLSLQLTYLMGVAAFSPALSLYFLT